MTREELWEAMVRKYPKFGNTGNVTLKTSGLRKLFDVVWDEAEHHGFYSVREDARQDMPDLFKEFFTPKR